VTKTEFIVAGKRYALACTPGHEERLVLLGARFDARVNELADALGDIGAERLFLAAGISLLDELESASRGLPSTGAAEEAQQRLRLVERRAAMALADAAERILALSQRVDEVG
jgi:cell division protein ZapA